MADPIGKQLSQARLARGLTIDEVAHATRLRPDKIIGLETDDYSKFGSNAYAKGFLQIYGRHLGIDVDKHARALEIPHQVSVAEYQYLNSAPEPANVRTPSRREMRAPSIIPAFVFLGIIFVTGLGFSVFVSAQRLGLTSDPEKVTPATAEIAPADLGATRVVEAAPAEDTDKPLPASNTEPAIPFEIPAGSSEPQLQEARAVTTNSDAKPLAYHVPGI